MKNIFILLVFVITLQIQAQKTFEVYNFSNQTINLGDIITRSGTALPEYHSKPFGLITIPPGGSYILENTSQVFRFPFNSPNSSPFITKWDRNNANGTTTNNVPSNVAWVAGNSQVFFNLKYFDGNGVLREIGVNQSFEPTPGFFVDSTTDQVSPNVWFYTIVFYN